MSKFIISTDSCADLFKSYLEEKNVYSIILKRITGGVVSEELFDSYSEYEAFYDSIRKGALPTTSALNPSELAMHFGRILEKEKEGDIVHISLSSGLSVTFDNAAAVAEELSQTSGRRVYAFDSLSASLGIAMQVDKLIELRDKGLSAEEAVKKLSAFRGRQQLWALVGNLFHLKRGGRLSTSKAAIGSLLGIRPLLIVNKKGGLAIEKAVRGTKKAIDYVLGKMEAQAQNSGIDITENTVYISHSSAKGNLEEMKSALAKRFPGIRLKEGMVGPIIGAHVGAGTVAVAFVGEERLDI